ncbi:hypothetical protein ACSQ67_002493 [Phaseolus vulgaris]
MANTATNNKTTLSGYFHSLSQTPQRLKKRMLATGTPDQELNQVRQRSGADMKRSLKWYDLVALGLGGMLGVGVFVTTGSVAHHQSGPSVFISYIIAGLSALLSSLCYTEFAVQVPVAGGAFSYLRLTFGEFVAYFAGANILMEYVFSNAAVSRSFTEYLSLAFGENDPNVWRVKLHGLPKNYNMLDLPAVSLILILTLCLCYSTKESSILNLTMTVFHVIFFGFIIVSGYSTGSVKTCYIGYDSASTLAEEIKDPSKSLPIGIVGSVLITTVLYCLMSLSLCMMAPYNRISDKSSFAFAFAKIGGMWESNLVGAGASLGIVASLLVAMLGQARYLCVIGRARLVPSWLAKVHPSTATPLNATLFLGVCTACVALFTDLDIIIELINMGTLVVFYLVANALIYHRYVITSHTPPFYTLLFLLLFSLSALGFSLSWKFNLLRWGLPLFGGLMITITAFYHHQVPHTHAQLPHTDWCVPFMPWPPVLSIFLNLFLITTLNLLAFQRFAMWTCFITLFYLLYGVHSTYQAEEIEIGANQVNSTSTNAQTNKVELQVL